ETSVIAPGIKRPGWPVVQQASGGSGMVFPVWWRSGPQYRYWRAEHPGRTAASEVFPAGKKTGCPGRQPVSWNIPVPGSSLPASEVVVEAHLVPSAVGVILVADRLLTATLALRRN